MIARSNPGQAGRTPRRGAAAFPDAAFPDANCPCVVLPGEPAPDPTGSTVAPGGQLQRPAAGGVAAVPLDPQQGSAAAEPAVEAPGRANSATAGCQPGLNRLIRPATAVWPGPPNPTAAALLPPRLPPTSPDHRKTRRPIWPAAATAARQIRRHWRLAPRTRWSPSSPELPGCAEAAMVVHR
ncbi:MAG: hypothetical protein ACTHKL_01670 [Streptosporangiaceae bacterium]